MTTQPNIELAGVASSAKTTYEPPSTWRLILVHTKYQILEQVRLPIAIVSNMAFPVLAFAAFVVPNPWAQDPKIATISTVQFMLFSMMSTALFAFGLSISEDRAQPWDPYVRTLPAGVWPRMIARILSVVPFYALGLAPLLVLSSLATASTVTVTQAVLGLLMVALGTIPFLLIGFAIGYLLPSKVAIAVVQLVLFPMAFLGGLFLPPEQFNSGLNAFSQMLPSRAARDMAVAVTTGGEISAVSILCLALWTVAALALALWGFRRDERRRFK